MGAVLRDLNREKRTCQGRSRSELVRVWILHSFASAYPERGAAGVLKLAVELPSFLFFWI